jgi:hypothetical protein
MIFNECLRRAEKSRGTEQRESGQSVEREGERERERERENVLLKGN